MANEQLEHLAKKVSYSFWEAYDAEHTVIRLATSWGTTPEETDKLLTVLAEIAW